MVKKKLHRLEELERNRVSVIRTIAVRENHIGSKGSAFNVQRMLTRNIGLCAVWMESHDQSAWK